MPKSLLLNCAGKPLDLNHPKVMGILNLTPDSFSDGGRFNIWDDALRHAVQMVEEGAAIIDIGGESTRPGAQPVSVDEELERVIPLIEALANEIPVPISVDTSKAQVMREAVSAGAGMINDIMALREPGALQVVAEAGVPVCLMHMQGEPRMMQNAPHYEQVITEVKTFLQARLNACMQAGISHDRVILDPGFGFGKTLAHNLELLKNLDQFESLNLPLLVGISRKSMIGALLGDRPVNERLFGSLAAAVVAAMKGGAIIRAHDVRATVDAMKIVSVVRS
ncbi:MAG: dihydropteroate synthase [Candidatus Thiodiazotropha sp.]|jgi:dihydropteroate synthase